MNSFVKSFFVILVFLKLSKAIETLPPSVASVIHSNYSKLENKNVLCEGTYCDAYQNGFKCLEGKFIPMDQVCDSEFYGLSSANAKSRSIMKLKGMDCLLGDDEVGCSNASCSLRVNKCSQNCLDLPGNKSRCMCYPGYRSIVQSSLIAGIPTYIESCQDIDECEIGRHKCRHGCQNLNGTYKCLCRDGYKVDPFDHYGTCKAEDSHIDIIYNSGSWIHSYNLEDKKSKLMVPSGRLDYIDYDLHTDIIYWWNKHKHKMQRSFLPGAKNGQVSVGLAQELDTNILLDNVQRFSLSVDWMGGNLYWLSRNILNKTLYNIMASTLDGRYIKTIMSVTQASSLVLDPENGVMYWISKEKEHNSKINSAWMNGWSHKVVHHFKKEMHPTVLALDSTSDTRLFWWDSISNFIFSSNTDGTEVRKVVSTNSALKPITMDIFEEYIYWVTNHSKQLVQHNKYGKGDTIILVKNLIHQSSLKIYHKNKISKTTIKTFRERCDINCKYLCMNTPVGFICPCPDGSTDQSYAGPCGLQQIDKLPDPLICDCSNKNQICNLTSPYSLCHCKAPCQYYSKNKEHQIYKTSYKKHSTLMIVLGVVFTIAIIVSFVLSFYKRNNSSLI